jgi:hypothetical protein
MGGLAFEKRRQMSGRNEMTTTHRIALKLTLLAQDTARFLQISPAEAIDWIDTEIRDRLAVGSRTIPCRASEAPCCAPAECRTHGICLGSDEGVAYQESGKPFFDRFVGGKA